VTAKHLARTKARKALLSLFVLALLAVALQSLVFSDASYVAGSSNAGNVFTTGSLSHENSCADQVVFTAANLRPGLSKEGTVKITGGGTITGMYTLSKGSVVDDPASPGLSKTLVLLVQEVGMPTPIYSGVVNAMPTLALGSIAPNVSRTFLLRLTYPAAGANSALDGATMTLPLTFTGTSS
jgi:spore coat-associated protein N